MTLVAGVDSSTQSCKVVILDAGSGALIREGRAAHPDGTEVHPDHWWRALSTAFDDAGGLTWRLRGYGPAAASPLGPDLDQLPATPPGRFALAASVPRPNCLALLDLGRQDPDPARRRCRRQRGRRPGAGGAAWRRGGVRGGTVLSVASRAVADPSGTVAGFADASGEYLPIAVTLNAARVLSSVAGILGVDFDEVARLALGAEPGAGGVVLVPYFEGERTPNLPHAKASFHGLSIASSTRSNLARAAIEGMLCGLSGGLEALRSQGGAATRILLIGGAVQNPAVQAIAAQVFDLPVVVPSPGEYVARGAAVQAAWASSGNRPAWPVAVDAEPAPDFHPAIRQNYLRASSRVDPGN